MIAFENTINEAKKAFGGWNKNGNTKEITVIRDVVGKLSFLLDTDIEVPGLASLFLSESDVKKGTVDYLLEAAVTPENTAIDMTDMVCQIDYILLDARAGFHDMGGVVTNELPHGVLLFGKDTKQSWQGVELVLNSISRVQADKPSVAIVDSAYGSEGFVSEDAKKSFTGQAYTVFSNTYYADDAQQPSPEAPGIPVSTW